jgi:hypothetical protein
MISVKYSTKNANGYSVICLTLIYLPHEHIRITIMLFIETHYIVIVDVEALSKISNESRIS